MKLNINDIAQTSDLNEHLLSSKYNSGLEYSWVNSVNSTLSPDSVNFELTKSNIIIFH